MGQREVDHAGRPGRLARGGHVVVGEVVVNDHSVSGQWVGLAEIACKLLGELTAAKSAGHASTGAPAVTLTIQGMQHRPPRGLCPETTHSDVLKLDITAPTYF